MEPAPTLISPPPEGATFGVGSTITWTLDGPGAPYTRLDMLTDKGPVITLWGGEDGSATVPDLSALGLGLPHGVTGVVNVFRESRATTAEDFASQSYISAQSPKPSSWGFSAGSVVTTP